MFFVSYLPVLESKLKFIIMVIMNITGIIINTIFMNGNFVVLTREILILSDKDR